VKINTAEHVRAILGVEGRAFARHVWPKSTRPERAIGLWSTQTWGASRAAGKGQTLSVELRFDDNCRNGHHSFAITGEIRGPKHGAQRDNYIVAAGCLHDDISRVFPELAPLIKWHLFDQTGPMHYVANTVYLAGDRDHRGLRKGEPRQLRNGRTGLPCWELALVNADGTDRKHAFEWIDSETCPQDPPTALYRPRMIVGEGKARQLDAARSVAVWPEATDAELIQEPEALKAALLARLPGLLEAFRRDMVDVCGFAWGAPK
jgi:hypothetical protein